jgi:F1F0 ATPase subunit 2
MMTEISNMILSFIVGMLLGTFFFGGLWFTVKKTVTSKIPALWVLSSFLFRVSITLAGFYFISLGDWKKLITCLVGFIIARFVVIHFTKPIDEKELQLKKEASHEA